jgi:hypothetical protein
MEKISLNWKRLFIPLVIVFSLLLMLPAGYSTKTSTILGSTYHEGGTLPALDLQANSQITQYIYDCSETSGYTAYNWFGSGTTEQHIYDAAFGVGITYSISFYIGHGGDGRVWNGIFWEPQWRILDDDGNEVFDKSIYPYSTCQNVRFVMVWSCESGNVIGGFHYWSGTAHGMPFCWLHTNDLSEDGYTDPDDNGYCFIGFENDAPGLLWDFEGGYWGVSYYFLGYFYRAALCMDKTVNQALDYASQTIWGVNFDECVFYTGIPDCGRMVVYGDGNLKIGSSVSPPSLPSPPSRPHPPGGGGCPFLYVWNGQEYVVDNNLLPTSEANSGSDVEDYYKLEQALVPIYQGNQFSLYSMDVREFEQEHSCLDQVKLLAVDHDSDVKISVTPDGEILTYQEPEQPMSCMDNNGDSRLSEILQVDGNISDPTTYYYGETGDYLIMNFGRVGSEDAKLILRDDIKCMICCIEVQVLADGGEWQTVSLVAPRDYWATEAVGLSEYVAEDEDLLVRLYWTSPHRLDYVGLDTSSQQDIELHEAWLIGATHSVEGNVRRLLKENDQAYAELVPDEQVNLKFVLPNSRREERTFVLYTEGCYYTISTYIIQYEENGYYRFHAVMPKEDEPFPFEREQTVLECNDRFYQMALGGALGLGWVFARGLLPTKRKTK